MGTFVEKAVLRVEDKSSKPLKKINKEIVKLIKTAQKVGKVKVDLRGLDKSTRDVNKLNTTLARLPRSKTINVKVNTASATTALNKMATKKLTANVRPTVTQAAVNAMATDLRRRLKLLPPSLVLVKPMASQSAVNSMATDLRNKLKAQKFNVNVNPNSLAPQGGLGPRRSDLPGVSTTRFPRNVGSAVTLGLGLEAAQGLRSMTSAAFEAASAMQQLDTRAQLLNFKPSELTLIEQAAQNASSDNPRVTETRTTEIAQDVGQQLGTDNRETFNFVVRKLTEAESAASAVFDPSRARQATGVATKLLDRSGQADDPEVAANIIDAATKAGLVLGETFSNQMFLTAATTSGHFASLAQSEEAIISFAAAVDDQGQKAGMAFARYIKVLEAQGGAGSGVAVGAVTQLTGSGLRTESGLSPENARLAREDPFKHIMDNVVPLLEEMEVDLNIPADVSKALTDIGFKGIDNRFVSSQIANADEIQRKRDQMSKINLDAAAVEAASAKNLSLQMDAVTAQFKNVSVDGLVPFAEALAPATNGLAAWLNGLANSEGAFSDAAKVGVALSGAAGQFAAMNADTIILGVAARSHMRAASKLSVAATMLQAGAVATAPGTRGKPGGKFGKVLLALGIGAAGAAAVSGVGQTEIMGSDENGEGGLNLQTVLNGLVVADLLSTTSSFAGKLAGPFASLLSLGGDTPKAEGEGNTPETRKALNDLFVAHEERLASAKAEDILFSMPVTTSNNTLLLSDLADVNREIAAALDPLATQDQKAQLVELREERDEIKVMLGQPANPPLDVNINTPVNIAPAPDLTEDLNRPIEQGMIDGSVSMADSMTVGAEAVGTEMTEAVSPLTEAMGALTAAVRGVDLSSKSDRAPVPRLDTGASTPF